MTTTTTPTHTILALDLGKFKPVACASDRATSQARFDTITTCWGPFDNLACANCQP